MIGITEKQEWNKKWVDIFDHYQQDLRHAHYINSVLTEADSKILEIAAGSFRDMAQLNKLGIDCSGTDYSEVSVELAKKQFPHLVSKIFQSDAFNFEHIKDNEFDVTFHNGFWTLFDENEYVLRLLKEQARITRNKIIVTVHNKHNDSFIEYFDKLSQDDNLYKIRFFEMNEIKELMLTICKSVDIIPVGKGKKYFEDELINKGLTDRKILKDFFDKTKLQNLQNSERLLCIGYL